MGRDKIFLLSIALNHFIRILILLKYKDYEENILTTKKLF